MRRQRLWSCAAPACLFLMSFAGCGTPGAPQPPSLNLPDPVADLSAIRTGDQVELTWTMPKKSTDKLMLKDSVAVHVCRREGTGACLDAGTELLAPGGDAKWGETLPPSLNEGTPRPLTYVVELRNKQGRSAGVSNAAVVLAGAPPPPVTGFRIELRKQGAVLHWMPEDESTPIRLQRTLLTPPTTKAKEDFASPPPEPVEQNLLVEDVKRGEALDKTIRFGETYAYRAQRVSRVAVDGKTLELAGALTLPVKVIAADVFPPAVPTGLVAVVTPEENENETSIDLSWEPDTERDVAGYRIYRRDNDGAWELVSSAEPVVGPAFHDAHVQPGHTYHYSVSAIDQGGHESARSAETEETVPKQ